MLDLVILGAAAVVAGIALVILATFATPRPKEGDQGRREVRGGGVIMIGPIPIIFGTDSKWAAVAIVLAIVLVILGIVATWGW